ncbi:L-threonylcarbamoyladenylate synthase [Candidatus Ishikawella capsulata]|uniref:hypothetical protein n=1 Tax=Candidatus Ishikawella capsulata TaxID=168169 RepID=UPI000694206D|nr:hypothetical protein [Candidatus Ishikawaella capsulata]
MILILSYYIQLKHYVKEKNISRIQKKHIFYCWSGRPGIFVVATPDPTLSWLTDKFQSLAIRVSKHLYVKLLCRILSTVSSVLRHTSSHQNIAAIP